jgi:predicted ATPase/DNA-binding SARP family transcriptional activator
MTEPISRNLHLLGPVQIALVDGKQTLRFRSQRTKVLLGYLATVQRSVARDSLAALFWPDADMATGRANLRRELHNLSLILPGCWQSDQATVQFIPTLDTRVDIVEVQQLDAAGQWVAAASWLHGEFVEGISITDNPLLDRWLNQERERWQRFTIRVLLNAAETNWLAGEAELSERALARILSQSPWYEEAHYRLMLLQARRGRFSSALKQFQRCREALETELDVAPSAVTEALYHRIIAATEYTLTRLPMSDTPFIGREAEMILLRQRLLDPGCRLLTVTGLGGSGKSRLALQAAHTLAEGNNRRFLHGAAFVSLVDVTAEQLGQEIANSLGLRIRGQAEADDQLLQFLRSQEMLLILDNYEHLMPVTRLVERILKEAPEVTLLITSRERLCLREEWTVPLEGLPYPPLEMSKADVSTFPAVRLFMDAIERTGYTISIKEQQSQGLTEICHLVAGMPLALLLAASWIETHSLAEMATVIKRNSADLHSHYRNLPPRHQSMQAVFDATWARLTPSEQAVFAALSVFHAGFSAKAAKKVAGASLALLKNLLAKSLIVHDQDGRYNLHNLLNQYAGVHLNANGRIQEVCQAHLVYFVTLAEETEAQFSGGNQPTLLHQLEKERPNFAAALQWASESNQIELAARLAGALGGFWSIRGHITEGMGWLRSILAHSDLLSTRTRAKTLFAAGWLAFESGEYHQAKDYYAASLDYWRETGDAIWTAELLNRLGHAMQQTGMVHEAAEFYTQSLVLYEQLGNKSGIALALNRLGHAMQLIGEHDRAAMFIRKSLNLRRDLGDIRGIAASANALAEMDRLKGDYMQAQSLYQESLAICEQLGDKRCIAALNHNLGHVVHRQGDPEHATLLFNHALTLYEQLRHNEGIALCLAGLAGVAGSQDLFTRAAQLFGAAEALLQTNQIILSPTDKLDWDSNKERLEARFDKTLLQIAWIEGRNLPHYKAIRIALQG